MHCSCTQQSDCDLALPLGDKEPRGGCTEVLSQGGPAALRGSLCTPFHPATEKVVGGAPRPPTSQGQAPSPSPRSMALQLILQSQVDEQGREGGREGGKEPDKVTTPPVF